MIALVQRGFAVIAICLLLAAALPPTADDHYAGRVDHEWDARFQRTEGWTGGDAIYSTQLPGSRTLWLFADSWVGTVANGQHGPGSRLVNNTLAVHPTLPDGKPPAFDDIRFHWGPNDGKGHATAWITPQGTPTNDNQEEKGWFWVGDAVVAPGTTGKDRLILFLWHIGRTNGDDGVFNFKSLGGRIALVENPADPITAWKTTQHSIPHFIGADNTKDHPRNWQLTWGSELILLTEGHDRPTVYIFGTIQDRGWTKKLVLARAPSATVGAPATWEFRTDGGWSPDRSRLQPLADGVTSEFSVHRHARGGDSPWILTHSEPIFGDRIFVRTASSIDGPWSSRRAVYRVPGVKKNDAYFTYAAKAHPDLSPAGELLITYVINSHDFGAMVRDANIYRPRFIRVPDEAIFGSAAE